MQVDQLEKNKVKLTFDVGAERFEEGMKYSYNKNKSKINLPGFRKGKAPRKMIEVQFGKEVFYDDAVNFVLGDAYEKALEESGLDVVSKPEIDIVQVSSEEGVVFAAEVYVRPEVSVSEYKGLTYVKFSTAVSEEEIHAEMETAREKNARIVTVTDRSVKTGDIVTIDFKGYVDEVPFPGGEGKDYELTIGSKSFIDTFEDQLIGKEVGDDVIVNVTFPAEYHEESLKGKAAKFEVEIKDIKVKEFPEVNDEFAQDVSEFDTLAEYKENIRSKIELSKKNEANTKKENEVMLKLIEKAEMDVPPVMIESQVDQQVNEFVNRIQMQGLPVDMYLQYMGQTMESLRDAYRGNAENQVKGRLALEKVAELEGYQATEEEIDVELDRMCEAYKMEKEALKKVLRKEDKASLEKDIAVKKALDYILEQAIEVEADPVIEIEDPVAKK